MILITSVRLRFKCRARFVLENISHNDYTPPPRTYTPNGFLFLTKLNENRNREDYLSYYIYYMFSFFLSFRGIKSLIKCYFF